MATVEVEADIDVDEYLFEASTQALLEEIRHRVAKGEITDRALTETPDKREIWTRPGLADDIRTAFYARNASRLEMLLMELERHEELAH
jgi:hypothetical protein